MLVYLTLFTNHYNIPKSIGEDIMDYEDHKFNKRDLQKKEYYKEKLKSNLYNFNSKEIKESLIYTTYQIEQGIKNHKFRLHFQPQYNLNSKQIFGAEALLRLENTEGELLYPDSFIPVAEYTNQILELDQYVFKLALQHKKHWENSGLNNLSMSINLCAKTLMSKEYFDNLLKIISSSNVDFTKLIVEVTETAIITEPNLASERLQHLKNLGFSIALDDFGTGFSSISHLQSLPIDMIKIDREIVDKLPENKKTQAIVKTIISLAQDIGYLVVAEGIENKGQIDYLMCKGCLYGQGYLFSKPITEKQFMDLVG